MVYSANVTDAELNTYLNASACELYDLLVSIYEDYYLTSVDFTLAGSSDGYSLPANFYKLRGVDYTSSTPISLEPFTFADRNRYQNVSAYLSAPKYRLVGSTLTITPRTDGDYTLWYIPQLTELTSDGDTFTTLQKWEEYIVLDAAIKMLAKEQDDVSVHMAQKQALIQRIKTSAPNRDAGAGERITDVYSRDCVWY
jgi:hypothetical protein